jgi:hypothetical protein
MITSPGLLGGLPTIDPNNGTNSQALGHLAMVDWLHLQPPWWNPFQGTGLPLAGEMQSAALFPFTIFTLMGNGQLYEHMLLEFLAGLATYLLLRRLSVSRWASTVAAIAFALNGTFAWFSHAPANPIAFLPLVLLGIETAFSASAAGRSGGWWLIATAGAFSIYAGFPETTYIDALLGVLWFAWRCGCVPRPRLRAFVAKVALGTIVAGLLAAPLLVPFLDYLPHTINIHQGPIGNNHLPHAALPQLLMPYVYGPIFGFADPTGTLSDIWGSVGGYLSTSLLLFGLLGLVSPGRRGLRAILLLWIVLAVAGTYGEPPGLSIVLGFLPDMSHIAFYRYADPALELAVVVLAAFGMDSLTNRPAPAWRLVAIAAASVAVVAAATLGAVPLAHKIAAASHRAYSRGAVLWALAVVTAGALAAILPSSRARRLLVASIVFLDAFVLFVLPELAAPRSVTIDTAPVAYLQRHQGLSRFFTLGPLQPNYAAYYGLRSLNANDAVTPSNFATYVFEHLDTAVNPLIFVGTSADRAPTAPSAQHELLFNLDGYRDAGVRYVLTPPGLQLPLGPSKFTLVLRSPTTWVYRVAGTSPYFTSTNPTCTVQAQSGQAARVSCPTSTTLVRRETYMPGWTAAVDGHTSEVRQYGDAFQAVTVGPGTHHVTFAFAPPRIHWAILGFAAGCLCLLSAPLLARARAERRSRAVTSS